jgi:hypothetical protein
MADLLRGNLDDIPSASPVGLFESAKEALDKVQDTYDYWSGKLTDITLQISFALIGANWAIFNSVNGILGSYWSKASMVCVLLALVSNVIAALALSEMSNARVGYAEENLVRWEKEFKENTGKKVAWPFTDRINFVGTLMRFVRTALIVLGGVFLIVGAVLK